jgi:hypothetical protein
MYGRGMPYLYRSSSVLVSLVLPTSELAAAAASAPTTRQARKRRIRRSSKANIVSGLEDVRLLKRIKMIGVRGTIVPEAKTNNDRTQGTSSGDRDLKSSEFEASCIVVAFY